MIDFPYIGLGYGLLGVLLLRFKNPNGGHLNLVTAFIASIFLSEIFFFEVGETAGQIVWAISGIGLVTAYILRMKSKPLTETTDYFKLISVILLALYPINFYTHYLFTRHWDTLIPVAHLIIPIAGITYFYDRMILKPEKMKRKFVLLLVGQTIVILLCVVFAIYKDTLAEHARRLVEENTRLASELREELENCRQQK